MLSSQERSFKTINKFNYKYSKKIDFSLANFEEDASWEYAQLSCKEKLIEQTASLKRKMNVKKILYPSVVILLLSITSAGVYGGIKMSSHKTTTFVSNDNDYKSLFESNEVTKLSKKSLDSVDKLQILKRMTNWADQFRDQLHFDEKKVKDNLINIVEPVISKHIGNDNYINIRYNIIDGTTLNADVRWSKVQNGKLVNQVYYDWLQIKLNDINNS